MPLTLHAIALGTFIPHLRTLSSLLDEGVKKFEPAVLVAARLAPDMYPLSKQVQLACYHAEDAAVRLADRPVGAIDLPEETLEQLRSRILVTIDALEQVPADAFAGAEDRVLRRPLQGDLRLECTGLQYLRDWSLAHFYFHVVTAYDILRHLGVPLGKQDYMRHLAPLVHRAT